MALNKIKKDSITADAIDATKVADDAISEEHLDNTAITGHTELSASAADDDVLLVFDTSAGTLKKIAASNVGITAPTFSSVSPTNLLTGDGTGNFTIVVTGTKFDATATFKLRTDGGGEISMDSVTRNSATQLTGTIAKNTANLTNANEPFDVIITNGNGLIATALNQINIDASPAFVTAAGTIGTVTASSAITPIDITAADPESAGTVTFDFLTGGLPAGLSSTTVHENGVSKLRISGTPTNPAATTTTNFTLRASDAASNTSTRAFSITITRVPVVQSFTSSGTFAVPSGMTAIATVLVVGAGGGAVSQSPNPAHREGSGGGGAGGLVFMPCHPVSPGGTITVTVGSGTPGCNGQDSSFGSPGDPGLNPGGLILTAKGGGRGGDAYANPGSFTNGRPGGSGGGANGPVAGTGDQPTQPGNSGAYGFGNPGGTGGGSDGGGGGGAGAAGANNTTGGIGKAYTIADGTTSVYYAGGGGGGPNHAGGQGGGASGGNNQQGGVNKGGGAGGSAGLGQTSSTGGKGIVIIRY